MLIFLVDKNPGNGVSCSFLSSTEILDSNRPDCLVQLLNFAPKLFPSEQRAIFEKLSAISVSDFVANVTSRDVSSVALKFLPPKILRQNFGKIRRKIDPKFLKNVETFPPHLVSF